MPVSPPRTEGIAVYVPQDWLGYARFVARFDAMITRPKKKNACWAWTGHATNGYPRIYAVAANLSVSERRQRGIPPKGSNLRAQRIVYFLAYGIDPGDRLITTVCGTRGCCRPDHLTLTTATVEQLRKKVGK